mmetsp:Transcript_34659/g.61806  ORF Transcript_34659/g.61806 Transcript_34659/m.61806 type:complete len:225 (-) Transcript_34659:33-707(-)
MHQGQPPALDNICAPPLRRYRPHRHPLPLPRPRLPHDHHHARAPTTRVHPPRAAQRRPGWQWWPRAPHTHRTRLRNEMASQSPRIAPPSHNNNQRHRNHRSSSPISTGCVHSSTTRGTNCLDPPHRRYRAHDPREHPLRGPLLLGSRSDRGCRGTISTWDGGRWLGGRHITPNLPPFSPFQDSPRISSRRTWRRYMHEHTADGWTIEMCGACVVVTLLIVVLIE